jgi:MoxR-like ATPase
MRLRIGYPDRSSEREIVRNPEQMSGGQIQPVLTVEEVLQVQVWAHRVTVDEAIVDYMLAIVEKTRTHDALSLGVSPRGAQALYRAAQALAIVEGRDYVIPDDVKRLAVPVFAHRVVVNTRLALPNRTADVSDRILEEILTQVDVPL